ncbi:hypothetical protein [Sphingorhabdus sp.]|jgi:hypothetical protein|uniref:Bbp19 family protein n=1 Tax=Sphingorhabdus sp. TaxID=1902408 RepID=UPI0037CC1051
MNVPGFNWRRWRSIVIAREYKDLCIGENGEIKKSAEHVLADLRGFCVSASGTPFHRDPVEMARRVGRREVFDRIQRMLGLSEEETMKLMEVDDGR